MGVHNTQVGGPPEAPRLQGCLYLTQQGARITGRVSQYNGYYSSPSVRRSSWRPPPPELPVPDTTEQGLQGESHNTVNTVHSAQVGGQPGAPRLQGFLYLTQQGARITGRVSQYSGYCSPRSGRRSAWPPPPPGLPVPGTTGSKDYRESLTIRWILFTPLR